MAAYQFSKEEWDNCIKVLQLLKDNPFENPDNQTFKTLVTAIHKRAKKQVKKETYSIKRAEDMEQLKATTLIAQAQQATTNYTHDEAAPGTVTVNFARHCYICGTVYHQLHSFYHRLCPDCAATNYNLRNLATDLTGYNVVLTGGRVKIGYATALKILRAGANLILTTRFPATALSILSAEEDYKTWSNRLTVYGLDLRNLKAVKQFITYCYQNLDGLDVLINNAAQTIKYPEEYYQPLIVQEQQYLLLHQTKAIANSTPIGELPASLPHDLGMDNTLVLNRFGQPVDYREKNSWNATIEDVGLEELLEVNMINHISPYCLISGLKALMLKSANSQKFIVNVTSSEGQFSYPNKNIFHPHTNMTKAALNMLTRTSGAELVRDNIYMNAVDVGWVSTGAHEAKRKQLFDSLRIPPLDPVDGAARILHAIAAIKDENASWYGQLLKDFKVTDW